MRNVTAKLLTPILKATGFRFSKDYRWGTTVWHRMVYRCVDTVAANHAAGWEIPAEIVAFMKKAGM